MTIEPGTPQTAADHSCANHDETLDEAYRKGVTDARAARDAEIRALEYAARNVVAAWKIPNVANAMAFDGLVEALRAILDADTGVPNPEPLGILTENDADK